MAIGPFVVTGTVYERHRRSIEQRSASAQQLVAARLEAPFDISDVDHERQPLVRHAVEHSREDEGFQWMVRRIAEHGEAECGLRRCDRSDEEAERRERSHNLISQSLRTNKGRVSLVYPRTNKGRCPLYIPSYLRLLTSHAVSSSGIRVRAPPWA
jgi:hypothetical protein